MSEDLYIKFLKEYYDEHGNISEFVNSSIVTYNGEELRIGTFLKEMKRCYKKYVESKDSVTDLCRERIEVLLSMGYNFEPGKAKYQDDKYIAYLREYYDEHGTINDIKSDEVVIYNGEELAIGHFLVAIKSKYYSYVNEDGKRSGSKSKLALMRYKALLEMGYDLDVKRNTADNDAFLRYMEKYYEENGTINDIKSELEVIFEGKVLKVGSILYHVREQYKDYLSGEKKVTGSRSPLALKRYEILNKMDIIWSPRNESLGFDRYIEYLKDYFEEHGTINDISSGKRNVVLYKGEELRIGTFLKNIRKNHYNYFLGINIHGSFSELSIKRYKELDKMGFIWDTQKEKDDNIENDIFIRYLKEHYEKNGTINDIKTGFCVEFEGKTLNLGNFVWNIRSLHEAYILGKKDVNGCSSKLALYRYQELDKMGFIWDCALDRKENDKHLAFLREYYETHGTINDIRHDAVVIYNGGALKIGEYIARIKGLHADYIGNKSRLSQSGSPLALARYKALEDLGIVWNRREINYSAIAKELGTSFTVLKKYETLFNGDIEKAKKIIIANKKLRNIKRKNKKSCCCIRNVLDAFDIDFNMLINYLSRSSVNTAPKSPTIMYDANMSLRDFCIQNGYNYDVISRVVKLKMKKLCNEDFDSLLNRVIVDYRDHGQTKPATWIYSKYGNEILVKHYILAMRLDPQYVLSDMTNNCITLEEAIENACFRRNTNRKLNSRENDYLEPIYHELVECYNEVNSSSNYNSESASDKLVNFARELVLEYGLTNDEYQMILKAFKHYTESIEQYHLFDVGFEKDMAKKIQKINDYHFDVDEIEEAFFVPLKFNEKVLVGRDSELYKRRVILKNLTVSWNSLTQSEKNDRINKYNLTKEEIYYIENTRNEIDLVKSKVKVPNI